MGYRDNCIDDGWTIYREERQLVMAAFFSFFCQFCASRNALLSVEPRNYNSYRKVGRVSIRFIQRPSTGDYPRYRFKQAKISCTLGRQSPIA